jgi:hypothetical protein
MPFASLKMDKKGPNREKWRKSIDLWDPQRDILIKIFAQITQISFPARKITKKKNYFQLSLKKIKSPITVFAPLK